MVENCTNITIRDLTVPEGVKLDLSLLKTGSVVTFEGETKWNHSTTFSGTLLDVGGTNITIQGAPCSVLNGNGEMWWDTHGMVYVS